MVVFWPGMIRDWTYKAARMRLLVEGRARLPEHGASVGLDERGNRIVRCACGWQGNGLGWLTHVDQVVRGSLSDEAS